MDSSGTRRLHRVNPVVSWGCPDTLGLFRVFGEMKGLLGCLQRTFKVFEVYVPPLGHLHVSPWPGTL